MRDGTKPALEVALRRRTDGVVELRSPAVGVWRGVPRKGDIVVSGAALGELEVLGVLHALRVPARVAGRVTDVGGDGKLVARPVGFGEVLAVLEPLAAGASEQTATRAGASRAAEFVLRAPTSGRFYRRPAPDKAAFVEVGDVVQTGQAVALIEVMKTFNRLLYGGPAAGLPERARVRALPVSDGQDIAQGDIILVLDSSQAQGAKSS